MGLTEFGKAVRKARVDIDETLSSMAKAMGVSPAFLSAMETGRKRIPADFVQKIEDFFASKDFKIEHLRDLATVSNKSILLDEGVSRAQQMMAAKFARSKYSESELKNIRELFETINGGK